MNHSANQQGYEKRNIDLKDLSNIQQVVTKHFCEPDTILGAGKTEGMTIVFSLVDEDTCIEISSYLHDKMNVGGKITEH